MSKEVNLKEYLHPKMDLLFVALNAPENSNNNGHWFTNNLSFWNILYRTGIIVQPIMDKLQGDEKVFGNTGINHKNWSIGVTDLNRSVVETDSSKVKTTAKDVKRIIEILDTHKVVRVCLMHSQVGRAFRSHANNRVTFNGNRFGLIGKYGRTDIFEVPFHNSSIPIKIKDEYYATLINGKGFPNAMVPKEKPKNQESLKSKREIVSKKSFIESSGNSFILPKPGNSITPKDIAKGQLRITVDFKKYFSEKDHFVRVKHLGRTYEVKYMFRDARSCILNVGREFMEFCGIDPKSKIKVTLVNGVYEFSKI